MKKIFLIMISAVLTLVSCNKQDINEPISNGENQNGTFTFNLALEAPLDENGKPETVETRATATVARYILEMYEGDIKGTKVGYENKDGIFNVTLKNGVDYVCLFWADGGTSDYDATSLKAVKQTTETATGKVAYYAAKTVNSKTFDGTVKLKRAVAELAFVSAAAIATEDNELVVTYPFASSTFNVSDGIVVRGTGTAIVRTFSGIGAVAKDGTVATDYILAPAAKTPIVDLKLKFNTEEEKIITETPVQANFRTKLKGGFVQTDLPATKTVTINGVAFDFVLVKGGAFQMGGTSANKDLKADNTQHWVKLTKDYYIGKTEVTQEQYNAIMRSNPSDFSKNPATGEIQNKRPVENVSWLTICGGTKGTTTVDNADCFLTKIKMASIGNITFRLPTEAEWEYAARGGHKMPAGYMRWAGTNIKDDLVNYGWTDTNSDRKTHEVGKKTANALGLYDMSGNVNEWCSDSWDRKDYNITGNSKDTPTVDPVGTVGGNYGVLRGGNWAGIGECLSAHRDGLNTDRPDSGNGFRLVLVL